MTDGHRSSAAAVSRRSPLDRNLVGATVAMAAVCFIMAVIGFQAQLHFFGAGDIDVYRGWTHAPLLLGGGVGLAVAVVASIVIIVKRGTAAQIAAATGIAVPLLLLIGGFAAYHHRSHPGGFERSAVSRLGVPASATTDVTTLGSTPQDGSSVASPLQDGPPVAVRSWGPTSCSGLHRVLAAWADRGSVQTPPPLAVAPPCFYFARYHDWHVVAEIINEQTTGTADIVIAPPPVGL